MNSSTKSLEEPLLVIHCATIRLTITKVFPYSGNVRILVSLHGAVNLPIRFKRVYLTVKRFVFFNELWIVRVENVGNVVFFSPLKFTLTLQIIRLRLIYGTVSNLARAGLTNLRKIISSMQWRINFIFGVDQLYVLVVHGLFL